MAAATSIIVGGAALLGAASSIAGGIEARKAAKEKEALIAAETREALEVQRAQTRQQIGAQTTAFAASGVDVSEGQTLSVLEATRTQGLKALDNIRRTGKAQQAQVRSQGRQALIGSVGGAIGSIGQGTAALSGMGVFNATDT